jgi:hypothetical protein
MESARREIFFAAEKFFIDTRDNHTQYVVSRLLLIQGMGYLRDLGLQLNSTFMGEG